MRLNELPNIALRNCSSSLMLAVGKRSTIGAALALASFIFGGPLQADDGRYCTDAVLNGDYGLVATGTRGTPTGVLETFVTVAMVKYDGNGNFTSTGTSHGSVTGVRTSAATGTYHVNRDCTGTETTNISGAPPLVDSFVIVDRGREVRTVVTLPASTVATANLVSK